MKHTLRPGHSLPLSGNSPDAAACRRSQHLRERNSGSPARLPHVSRSPRRAPAPRPHLSCAAGHGPPRPGPTLLDRGSRFRPRRASAPRETARTGRMARTARAYGPRRQPPPGSVTAAVGDDLRRGAGHGRRGAAGLDRADRQGPSRRHRRAGRRRDAGRAAGPDARRGSCARAHSLAAATRAGRPGSARPHLGRLLALAAQGLRSALCDRPFSGADPVRAAYCGRRVAALAVYGATHQPQRAGKRPARLGLRVVPARAGKSREGSGPRAHRERRHPRDLRRRPAQVFAREARPA